jgi:abortive infection bacteriophage resistance protein
MEAVKPPTTYQEQVNKLRARGCVIADEDEAMGVLSHVNYYRLTAYFLPFKRADGTYSPDTNFNTIYRIYEFDRKIRHIIFSAIEEIEVFVRSTLAYYHGHKYGPLGYLDHNNYNQRHKHIEFIAQIDAEKQKQSKELFVQHHMTKYGGKFPIWAIIELFSFGTLSHFYADLPVDAQKHLARTFYKTHQRTLSSWLYCCTILRNICAHFGRLYYRKFTVIPNGIPDLDQTNSRSLFGAIMAVKLLYPDSTKWNKETHGAVAALIAEYQNDIQLKHIGFPADWEAKLRSSAMNFVPHT